MVTLIMTNLKDKVFIPLEMEINLKEYGAKVIKKVQECSFTLTELNLNVFIRMTKNMEKCEQMINSLTNFLNIKEEYCCHMRVSIGIDCNGSFLDIRSSSVPVGTLSLLLSGKERSKVLLVDNTLVCSTSWLSWLFHLCNFWCLLSDFSGLGKSTVLFAH